MSTLEATLEATSLRREAQPCIIKVERCLVEAIWGSSYIVEVPPKLPSILHKRLHSESFAGSVQNLQSLNIISCFV